MTEVSATAIIHLRSLNWTLSRGNRCQDLLQLPVVVSTLIYVAHGSRCSSIVLSVKGFLISLSALAALRVHALSCATWCPAIIMLLNVTPFPVLIVRSDLWRPLLDLLIMQSSLGRSVHEMTPFSAFHCMPQTDLDRGIRHTNWYASGFCPSFNS